MDDQASLLLTRNQGRPKMRKIIATIILLSVSPAFAGDKSPTCLGGYQWYPDKKACLKMLDDDTGRKADCKIGAESRRVERRNGRKVTIVSKCGYM